MAFITDKFPGGACEGIRIFSDHIECSPEGTAYARENGTGNVSNLRCLVVGKPEETVHLVVTWPEYNEKTADHSKNVYWYVQSFFRVAERVVFVSEDELHWTRIETVRKEDWTLYIDVTLPQSGRLYLSVNLPFPLKYLEQVCEKFAPWRIKVADTAGGLDMPAFRFGDGKKIIWLQANQHVTETSGSYVLSSLMEVLADPKTDTKDFTFIVIPSVAVEKMIGGMSFAEYSKNINRDWMSREQPEVQGIHNMIQKLLGEGKELTVMIDMHNGWCRDTDSGGNITEYNHGFIADEYWDRRLRFTRAMLASCDYEHPDKIWWREPNDGSTCFQYGSLEYESLSYTYEFSRFEMYDREKGGYVPLSQEHLLRLGKQFAKFLLDYPFE